MATMEYIAAAQIPVHESRDSNPVGTAYFVVALVAIVVGLVVWIIIRARAGRSSRR